MPGPLEGIRIIEMAGIGPGPFAGMMLADHGAEVIRIDRIGKGDAINADFTKDVLQRSRKRLEVDLKSTAGIALVRDLARGADGLIEGFRPGVMERLGLGPDVLQGDNPKLVYGRMTGWGQTGPLARAAGHDINYIALSGALDLIGPPGGKPVPPLNLVGDFGGGAMMLLFGMLAGLLHVRGGGEGQVIDCAMTDGAAMLSAMIWGFRAQGQWDAPRGGNLLDGGAHFYDTYETADGKWISIGSIEPQFYALLREKAGLDDPAFDAQTDQRQWPALTEKLTALFRTKTRDEWCAIMEGTDICFAPVLGFADAPKHPHNAARGTFIEVAGVPQPAPTPRYSKLETVTPSMADGTTAEADVLASIGYDQAKIAGLRDAGVIG